MLTWTWYRVLPGAAGRTSRRSRVAARPCHCLVQGVDLLRPARVAGQPPVLGVDEGLRGKGDHLIGPAPGAKEKRGESAGGGSGHHDAFRAQHARSRRRGRRARPRANRRRRESRVDTSRGEGLAETPSLPGNPEVSRKNSKTGMLTPPAMPPKSTSSVGLSVSRSSTTWASGRERSESKSPVSTSDMELPRSECRCGSRGEVRGRGKVGVRGLEPPASASQTPRATNCATPRNASLRVYGRVIEGCQNLVNACFSRRFAGRFGCLRRETLHAKPESDSSRSGAMS